jgi:glutamine amidotransferase
MNIAIVDYYSGNVASVTNSFKKVGDELDNNIEVTLSNDLNIIENSDKLVLPGQGSFKNCINSINKIDGLRETLDDFVSNTKKRFFFI